MIENQSIKKLRPHLQKLQEQNDLEARKRGYRPTELLALVTKPTLRYKLLYLDIVPAKQIRIF